MNLAQTRARSVCALVVSLALSACGGGGGSGGGSSSPDNNNGNNGGNNNGGNTTEQFTVGGTITGADSGLVTLSLNGSEESFSEDSFTFTTTLDNGTAYTVRFVNDNAQQSCVVQNGAGVISANVTNITVACSPLASEVRFSDASPYGPMSVGDYNGDGYMDIVVAVRSNEFHPSGTNQFFLRTMLGNGAGGYTQDQEYQQGLIYFANGEHMPLITGDLNNDPSDDFLAITVGNIERYLGQQNAAPEKATDVISYWNNFSTLFVEDVTGDGNQDIVSFNYQPGNSALDYFATIPGNGDGSFGEAIGSASVIEMQNDPTLSALGIERTASMTIGDFNGDSLSDLITLSSNQDQDAVMLGFWAGSGDGTFEFPVALQALPQDLHIGESTGTPEAAERSITSADIDLDGDLDIAIGSTGDFVLLLENDGSGSFSVKDRIRVGNYPVSVKLIDLNLDGNVDMVTDNQNSKTIGISWGQSDGSFGERGDSEELFTERQLDNVTQFGSVLVSDMDNSGYADIVYAETETNKEGFADGSVQIILNPGM